MPKIKFVCEFCKKEFLEYRSNRVRRQVFCSRNCSDKGKMARTVPWNKGHGEYMRGEKNYFYGKKHNRESLKKISRAGKGRKPWNSGINQWKDKLPPRQGTKQSVETRIKISKALRGKLTREKNPAWKGGTQSLDKIERVRFRKTMQKQIFERDNYTCQLCGNKIDLQVDHIQPWAEYVGLRFDINNCRTICKPCHYKITFGRPMVDEKMPWGHNLQKGGDYHFC